METPSYIAKNPEELFDQAPADIQALITGDEVNNATAILGKLYKIPVSSYVALENIISFIMIGALKPEDAVRAIKDLLGLDEDTSYKLAADLDKTILEKARIQILGKAPTDMVTLSFQEGRSPDELRKEILDTTKRGPLAPEMPEVAPLPEAPVLSQQVSPEKPPVDASGPVKAGTVAGSRSQLLEQLKILDNIPTDDEIAERLKKIQDQIAATDKESERGLQSPVALAEFMPKDGVEIAVNPKELPATYSKAPTKYNVDPYREVVEE